MTKAELEGLDRGGRPALEPGVNLASFGEDVLAIDDVHVVMLLGVGLYLRNEFVAVVGGDHLATGGTGHFHS